MPPRRPARPRLDPGEIAMLRSLLAHARAAGWEHAMYQLNDGPVEHVWRRNGWQVSLHDGRMELGPTGRTPTWSVPARSPSQCAIVLAANGVIPHHLAGGQG